MSPRPAILFSLLLVILLLYYLMIDRGKTLQIHGEQEKANLLELAGGVEAVDLNRGGERVRFQKTSDGKLFEVVAPQGGFAPQDLMNAIAGLLMKSNEVEIVNDNASDLAQYGLDHPVSEVDIQTPGKSAPVKVYFGGENPTHTAFYAKLEGSPRVFLLGMDLRYYQDLMFEWIEGKQGKKA